MAENHLRRERYDRNTCDLADIRNRAGGSRIYLNHIYLVLVNNKLDVDHSENVKGIRELPGVGFNLLLDLCRKILCRIHRDTVSGVNACPLDMLHDARDQDILAVADRVDLDFGSRQIFIDQNRMLLRIAVDNTDVLTDIIVADRNLHALSSQYIGRTHKNRIAELVGDLDSLFRSKYRAARSSRNAGLPKDLIEPLPVFRSIYIRGGGAENRDSHLHQRLCELDGRLTAELHDSSIRMLDVYNVFHIFRCKRLKIELVRDIEVSGNGLRVVVDDDGFIAFLFKRPGGVDRTEIKLNSLADSDWSGTEYENLLSVSAGNRLILTAVNGVEVRSLRGKFRGAGINHFVCGGNSRLFAHLLNFCFGNRSVQLRDQVIRELHPLCLTQGLHVQPAALQGVLHLYESGNLVDKPDINLCNGVNAVIRYAPPYCLRDSPDPHIIDNRQIVDQLILRKAGEIVTHERIHMLFQGTDCLHQCSLEIRADTHDLAGCLHLCRKCTLCRDELVKRKPRDLDNAVVKHRLEACEGFLRDGVRNFIQGIAEGDLRSDLRDRITGCL